MKLCLIKLSVILEIDPFVLSLDFFNKRIIAATSNFQSTSAKNDSLSSADETIRFYDNSKHIDKTVRWVLFILAEYILKYHVLPQ